MKKVFLDSDIILDALLKRPGFDLYAKNIMALAYKSQIKMFTSSVAFVNTNYFIEKFDKVNSRELLKKLRSVIEIIDVGEEVIDLALQSDFIDFEDAVQFFSAKSVGVNFIITRNIKDYKHSTIEVLSAEQFLKTLA